MIKLPAIYTEPNLSARHTLAFYPLPDNPRAAINMRCIASVLAAAAMVAASLPAASARCDSAGWVNQGYDRCHTHQVRFSSFDQPVLGKMYRTGNIITGSPAVNVESDRMLGIAGASDYKVRGYDLKTGDTRYEITTGHEVRTPVTLLDGGIGAPASEAIIAAQDKTVRKIKTADGATVWTTTTGSIYTGAAPLVCYSTDGGPDLAILSSIDGRLRGFRTDTGENVWTYVFDFGFTDAAISPVAPTASCEAVYAGSNAVGAAAGDWRQSQITRLEFPNGLLAEPVKTWYKRGDWGTLQPVMAVLPAAAALRTADGGTVRAGDVFDSPDVLYFTGRSEMTLLKSRVIAVNGTTGEKMFEETLDGQLSGPALRWRAFNPDERYKQSDIDAGVPSEDGPDNLAQPDYVDKRTSWPIMVIVYGDSYASTVDATLTVTALEGNPLRPDDMGRTWWTYTNSQSKWNPTTYSSTVTCLGDGSVLVPSTSGNFYLLNGKDGTQLWQRNSEYWWRGEQVSNDDFRNPISTSIEVLPGGLMFMTFADSTARLFYGAPRGCPEDLCICNAPDMLSELALTDPGSPDSATAAQVTALGAAGVAAAAALGAVLA